METETRALVESIERSARINDNVSVVTDVRELWNWRSSTEDCDVELKIGTQADLNAVLKQIEMHPEWTMRFFHTSELTDDDCMVRIALVHHNPTDPTGTLRLTGLFEKDRQS